MAPLELSEKTKLPLGLVIGFVAMAISIATVWASLNVTVSEHLKENEKDLAKVNAQVDETDKILRRIDRRLSNIEGRLGIHSEASNHD